MQIKARLDALQQEHAAAQVSLAEANAAVAAAAAELAAKTEWNDKCKVAFDELKKTSGVRKKKIEALKPAAEALPGVQVRTRCIVLHVHVAGCCMICFVVIGVPATVPCSRRGSLQRRGCPACMPEIPCMQLHTTSCFSVRGGQAGGIPCCCSRYSPLSISRPRALFLSSLDCRHS